MKGGVGWTNKLTKTRVPCYVGFCTRTNFLSEPVRGQFYPARLVVSRNAEDHDATSRCDLEFESTLFV